MSFNMLNVVHTHVLANAGKKMKYCVSHICSENIPSAPFTCLSLCAFAFWLLQVSVLELGLTFVQWDTVEMWVSLMSGRKKAAPSPQWIPDNVCFHE